MRIASWGIRNPVPTNLIMLIIIALGLAAAFSLKRELFPKFAIDKIQITVVMEGGSTPEQVDRNVVQIIQSRIQNIDGVKEVNSLATENIADIKVEVESGYDVGSVKMEIQDEVDAIITFPTQALEPRIRIIKHFEKAIRVAIFGIDATDLELRDVAEFVKNDLRARGLVTRAELHAPRPLEMSITIPTKTLEAKGLTMEQVARQIREYNFEITAGKIRADQSDIVIKGEGRKTTVDSLRQIPIHFPNGEDLLLEELAGYEGIIDGFVEDNVIVEYNGQKASIITIEPSENDDIIDLCDRVRAYVDEITLPHGIKAVAINDLSIFVRERLALILRNGAMGLVLVLVVLSLFLEWRVAFWTAAGIAFSLIGASALLYLFGGTINMLTLFGFLMTTGLIVDDAVVVGESFYHRKQKGFKASDAALAAMDEVAYPVLAMVATTLVAFCPLLFVSGLMGKFIEIIPSVIMAALLLSLLEALLILPSHLAHHCGEKTTALFRVINTLLHPVILAARLLRPIIDQGLSVGTKRFLIPLVHFAVQFRYASLTFFFTILIFLIGLIPAGLIKTALFPRPDAEQHALSIEFDKGTPIRTTEAAMRILIDALLQTAAYYEQEEGASPIREYFMEIGSSLPNKASLMIELSSAETGRRVSGQEFIDAFRNRIPPIPNLVSLEFLSQSAGPPSKPIVIWLTSRESELLEEAERETMEYLRSIEGVVDITTNNRPGALTVEVNLKPEFRNLPISEEELLTTLTYTYQGFKIDTFYRGDNEVKTYLRASPSDRVTLDQMKELRLSNGMTVGQVAELRLTRDPSVINRINGDRTTVISADVNLSAGANAADIRQKLQKDFLDSLPKRFPEVRWTYAGESREGGESIDTLLNAYSPALLVIYLILATIFRSYIQPLVIMVAIPFSFVGALIGHLVMGLPFNLMSGFGIVALTGIAVNDSLVLIDCINNTIRRGRPLLPSLLIGCKRRVRPILLTSLTTVAGMAPILFETSFQAQFLIPMVTSIVFGISISTLLILVFIPVGYTIVLDCCQLSHRLLWKQTLPKEHFVIPQQNGTSEIVNVHLR